MTEGKCTKCGSENLEYGVLEPEDNSVLYPYECLDCGHEGKEYYTLEYDTSD
jgi:DNA-directed RNA polymerase subunit RPC12/RpoP